MEDAEKTFQVFERKRISRTTRIVENLWSLGKVAQLRNPLLVRLRNTALKWTPPTVAEKQMKFITDISFA